MKWLSNEIPDIVVPFFRKTKIVDIPLIKLQQLARILNFIAESNSLSKEKYIDFSNGDQNKESNSDEKSKNPHKEDLGTPAQKAKRLSRRKVGISFIDIEERRSN